MNSRPESTWRSPCRQLAPNNRCRMSLLPQPREQRLQDSLQKEFPRYRSLKTRRFLRRHRFESASWLSPRSLALKVCPFATRRPRIGLADRFVRQPVHNTSPSRRAFRARRYPAGTYALRHPPPVPLCSFANHWSPASFPWCSLSRPLPKAYFRTDPCTRVRLPPDGSAPCEDVSAGRPRGCTRCRDRGCDSPKP